MKFCYCSKHFAILFIALLISCSNILSARPHTAIIDPTKGQYIVFPPLQQKSICSTDFAAGARSNGTVLPITYASSNPAVATVTTAGIIHVIRAGTTIITASQAGNDLYIAAEPQTQLLIVNNLPQPGIIVNPADINSCEGEELKFIAKGLAAGNNPTYQWKLNGQNVGDNSDVYISSSFKTGDVVTCVVTNNDGCVPMMSDVSAEITGLVRPITTISVSIARTQAGIIYAGTPVTFKATPSGNIVNQIIYDWYINGRSTGNNSPVFTTSTLADNDVVSCYIDVPLFNMCIINPFVQSNLILVKVKTVKDIIPPNTFTPNNDGVNDTWDIPGLSSFAHNNVSVYDRYGSIVYQSAGYNIPWDGSRNNHALPVGTYYYIINLNDGSRGISGSVTIIR
ncbi:gliding motility-associated C-terminal domain-containing protein [Mucilaginibacter jinjuensis]|uniref:Gliding motility-associated C-terminal domain-containing protein n=1 Tax=Mucilaginibacter jinjuensis TaxID=1176721 RepID=A0ABY7T3K6_9SPHI|nr:gliding motility-associated C-terminal domain-containing protein [Mucilaginibacter jinjuensis]WCT10843.1 gliding motility-associated C-terminal domain-containing protein [Mucilaginibacter jinjuensis]